MCKATVIQNAQIVLENGIIWDGVIVIEDGRILQIGSCRDIQIPADACCIDAGSAYVGPGFVDLHVHGGNGYSICFAPKKAAEFFLRHGTTSLLCAPSYVMTGEEMLDAIGCIRDAMKTQPTIKGIYMEGPFTNPKYGAHADHNPWKNGVNSETFHALVDACGEDVKVWTIAPELPNLMPFLEYARRVNPDVVFSVGHSEATPMQISSLGKYRPALMTHTMNATGRIPVYGGTRSYGPDEYCFQQPDMFAELISDSCGIHVHPQMQQLLLHTKGLGRVLLITDSTEESSTPPPECSHVEDLNFDDNGGIAGSKMTMDQACRNIMANTNCGIAQAFVLASLNPAKVIGMDHEIGSIQVGKIADLVFVDDKFHVQQVMLAGRLCQF